jgi:tudor domain-containing protein 1/4/6/7
MTVTYISSPYYFYVQEVSNEFVEFEQTFQKFYTSHMNTLSVKHPKVGQICVAKYSEDQNWYRAIIKEVNRDLKTVRVFFVDYGNEDVLSMSSSNDNSTPCLCDVADDFKKYPMQAMKCSLIGIGPISGSKISPTEISDFMFVEMPETVMVKFVDMSNDLYYVDVCFNSKDKIDQVINLKALLLEKNYAQLVNTKQTLNMISNQHLKIAENGMSDKLGEFSDIRHIINDKFSMENVKYRNS